jgi:hypothetical protein
MEIFKDIADDQNYWDTLGAFTIITTIVTLTAASIYLCYNSEASLYGIDNQCFGSQYILM